MTSKNIFDPEFNGLPGINNYRGDVDRDLGGKDYKPPRWENWPEDELKIFNINEYRRLFKN